MQREYRVGIRNYPAWLPSGGWRSHYQGRLIFNFNLTTSPGLPYSSGLKYVSNWSFLFLFVFLVICYRRESIVANLIEIRISQCTESKVHENMFPYISPTVHIFKKCLKVVDINCNTFISSTRLELSYTQHIILVETMVKPEKLIIA
jgi:hypothetical protein